LVTTWYPESHQAKAIQDKYKHISSDFEMLKGLAARTFKLVPFSVHSSTAAVIVEYKGFLPSSPWEAKFASAS
jgi:hypothetical protein